MSESTSTMHHSLPDLSFVQDPDVRHALRLVCRHLCETIEKQQMVIEALLEMMMEKHMGSLGEFKRHLIRLHQNDARGQRIRQCIEEAAQAFATAPPAAPPPQQAVPGTHNPAR